MPPINNKPKPKPSPSPTNGKTKTKPKATTPRAPISAKSGLLNSSVINKSSSILKKSAPAVKGTAPAIKKGVPAKAAKKPVKKSGNSFMDSMDAWQKQQIKDFEKLLKEDAKRKKQGKDYQLRTN